MCPPVPIERGRVYWRTSCFFFVRPMKPTVHCSTLSLFATRTRDGMTLIELLVGLAILLAVGAAATTAMVQLNRQSQIHRLYSIAAMDVQNQIQLCLNDGPYIPDESDIPTALTAGTTSTSVTLTAPNDPNDPNDFLTTGTMNTTVTTANSTLNVVQVYVSLTFNYRSKSYTVAANTMRSTDL